MKMFLPSSRPFQCLVVIIVLLVPTVSFSQNHSLESGKIFESGNRAYSQGHYTEAIGIYEELLAEKGLSASLLYNLANSYAQAGMAGKAVLNYKKALLLSPGDSDILGNLDLVRKNQGLFQEEPSFREKFTQSLSINQWALLALVCLLFIVLFLLAGLRFLRYKSLTFWGSGCAFLLLILSCIAAFSQYRFYNSAVVIQNDVRLLLSPFPSASSTGILQEGRLVLPEKQHGNFYLVEDETGRSGWINGTAIEFITTPLPGYD